jgi:hypothetical protein
VKKNKTRVLHALRYIGIGATRNAWPYQGGTQIAAIRQRLRGQSTPWLAGQKAHSGFDTYVGSTRPGLLWIDEF